MHQHDGILEAVLAQFEDMVAGIPVTGKPGGHSRGIRSIDKEGTPAIMLQNGLRVAQARRGGTRPGKCPKHGLCVVSPPEHQMGNAA
jgi:hypothetical protein